MMWHNTDNSLWLFVSCSFVLSGCRFTVCKYAEFLRRSTVLQKHSDRCHFDLQWLDKCSKMNKSATSCHSSNCFESSQYVPDCWGRTPGCIDLIERKVGLVSLHTHGLVLVSVHVPVKHPSVASRLGIR